VNGWVSLLRGWRAIRPDDLVHPMHSKISFRDGRSDFERTLGLFQKVAHANLRQVPSEYLKIVADDACETLARLHEIQSFTGEGVEHPEQMRPALIAAVHDAYPPIYEDLSDHQDAARQARTGAKGEDQCDTGYGRRDGGACCHNRWLSLRAIHPVRRQGFGSRALNFGAMIVI